MTTAKQAARRAIRLGAAPLLNYVDRRLDRRLSPVINGLAVDAQTIAELSVAQTRQLARLTERLEALPEVISDLHAQHAVGGSLDTITPGIAAFANWLETPVAYAGQSHLWFNLAVWLKYEPGRVSVRAVNERSVEIPFVLQALSKLPPASRILDFGSLESLVPLYLASIGHRVSALDLHPYPLDHPLIDAVVTPVETWHGPEEPFDAVVSLSTLEHVGLAGYGQPRAGEDLDTEVMTRFRTWMRRDGLLVFTAPFGRWRIDEFQRTYDLPHLGRLLEGYRVLEQRYAVRDGRYWTMVDDPPVDAEGDNGATAVVLVTATVEV